MFPFARCEAYNSQYVQKYIQQNIYDTASAIPHALDERPNYVSRYAPSDKGETIANVGIGTLQVEIVKKGSSFAGSANVRVGPAKCPKTSYSTFLYSPLENLRCKRVFYKQETEDTCETDLQSIEFDKLLGFIVLFYIFKAPGAVARDEIAIIPTPQETKTQENH